MNSEVDGCRPAASVLNVSSVSCEECPFPFCVSEEAQIIQSELREHITRIMRRLGNSMEETAKAMDVSLRSVYRYAGAYVDVDCVQCNLIHSQNVMCKSNVYSVVYKDGQYTVILNKHRHATAEELKLVECFVEYVFPSSITEQSTNGHDHWVMSRVELEEAKKFQQMCNALNSYTLSLGRSAKCLQTA